MFLQQSASPLYVPFSVLEYYALADELHGNFETINAGKQVLNCLTFRHVVIIISKYLYKLLSLE